MADILLGLLWGLSVFAGWGTKAFCSDLECAERMVGVAMLSGLFALVAACCTAVAWLSPQARGDEGRFTALTGAAVIAWVAAEGTLFVGGLIAR
ncbi:hypothetical protein GCM10010156_34790 [Planobispora rosea]|uniref:hypothetical protein n=1 Tax=Planobispora rosea TaxID=35762 RepID=UPI00083BA2BA|nr:hypothetical protein [Planobispora rosea]GGS72911.1 hypothetical protein GCM10010156_34790 [Planobispora rosea]